MGWAGFGKTQIRYDMFDLERDVAAARRLDKCERIYHKGQTYAWNGRAVLSELLEEHGGVHLGAAEREALRQLFAIILWGEMAAWKISLQLADGLVPLEAKMAATSQAFDEARHFYVMYDYLSELGDVPKKIDRAPQALLDLTLDTDHLVFKLLGMQLLIEPMALSIFQFIRESRPEPVLAELMRYYERDEARHVGLGMQYFPILARELGPLETARLLLFQTQLLGWSLAELKVLEPHFEALGLDPRTLIASARSKQMVVLHEAFQGLGFVPQEEGDKPRGLLSLVDVATGLLFPDHDLKGDPLAQAQRAWEVFCGHHDFDVDPDTLAVHDRHTIKTELGVA